MQYNMDNSSSSTISGSSNAIGHRHKQQLSVHETDHGEAESESIRRIPGSDVATFPQQGALQLQLQQQQNTSTKNPARAEQPPSKLSSFSTTKDKDTSSSKKRDSSHLDEMFSGGILGSGDSKRPRMNTLRPGNIIDAPVGMMDMAATGKNMGMDTNVGGSHFHSGLSPQAGQMEMPFPRPPTSPGTLDISSSHTHQGVTFGDANTTLRQHLGSLHRLQHQHQQSTGLAQQQQIQMQDFQMQQFLQEQQQQNFQNQSWGSNNMPFGGGPQGPLFDHNAMFFQNASTGMGMPMQMQTQPVPAAQFQFLRQQQERLRQLEQMQQQAAVRRRQLQLMTNNTNPLAFGGNSAQMPGMQLQNTFQSQSQGFSGFSNLTGQQRQMGAVQPQEQLSMQPMMAATFSERQGNVGTSKGSSSKPRNARPGRKVASASAARATPMEGPLAPPVPAPPQLPDIGIPPIDEGELPPYDQRVHVPLAIAEDPNWLSEFQAFVRQELLEVFRASHEDVKVRSASKKVFYQQVGIRCRYCAHCKPSTKSIRSSAFPSSIRQLYQSFTMMLRDHFGSCPAIPAPLKQRFLNLKRNNTQGASDSMRYWMYSAKKLGMVDTENGIVINETTKVLNQNKAPFGSASTAETQSTDFFDRPARLLVKPEDKDKDIKSEFLYFLLTQYQLIKLRPTECIGNRKSLRPGVPGLGCRYCCNAGRLGLSRIYPAKKKHMAGQIQDLYDHIRRCNLCPADVKNDLHQLRVHRDRQATTSGDSEANKKIIRFENEEDKAFIDLLWKRLGHQGELANPAIL